MLRFFKNRKPCIIRIDDKFPADTKYNLHPFVKVANRESTRELWPLLIEKAYAKLYGNYDNIAGGLLDAAMMDLTNGAGNNIDLKSDHAK